MKEKSAQMQNAVAYNFQNKCKKCTLKKIISNNFAVLSLRKSVYINKLWFR